MAWVKAVKGKNLFVIYPYCGVCGSFSVSPPKFISSEKKVMLQETWGEWFPGIDRLDIQVAYTYIFTILVSFAALIVPIGYFLNWVKIEMGLCTSIEIILCTVSSISLIRLLHLKALRTYKSEEFASRESEDYYCKCYSCGESFRLPSSADESEDNPKNHSPNYMRDRKAQVLKMDL